MAKRATKKKVAPTADAAARVDRDLVATAYRKVMDGDELTKQERAALKRHEKDKEERLRWQYYAAVPQKHWRQMSGRQTKVINEQSARHGIPFGGASINLPAVVRGFHDFLADNAYKLARDDDALMQGAGSQALERYREERAALARLDRLEREQKLVPRDEVREILGRVAALLRGAGDRGGRGGRGGRGAPHLDAAAPVVRCMKAGKGALPCTPLTMRKRRDVRVGHLAAMTSAETTPTR